MTIRFDGYDQVSPLGQGGMACVFLARRVCDGEVVVLKTIHADRVQKLIANLEPEDAVKLLTQFQGRFQREIEVARLLAEQCPERWIRVDSSEAHHSPPFYAMEYIPGSPVDQQPVGTLEAYLACQPISECEAVWVVCEAAKALEIAHDQGIIHRDLKPSNLFLRKWSQGCVLMDCEIVLADCGICRDNNAQECLTLTGQRIGSPSYMAPEQYNGQSPIGPWTDVWALGVLLHRLVAEALPFLNENDVSNKEPPLLRDARIDVQSIVRRCLAKRPEQRYRTAAELIECLDRVLEHTPIA